MWDEVFLDTLSQAETVWYAVTYPLIVSDMGPGIIHDVCDSPDHAQLDPIPPPAHPHPSLCETSTPYLVGRDDQVPEHLGERGQDVG